MALPWQDRLARAKAGPPAAAPTDNTAPQNRRPASARGAEDLATVAPGLRSLLEERAALERRMAQLTGGTQTDPRYPVASMADRRAELAQWASLRDRRANDTRASADGPMTRSARPALYPDPPLRTTPGEAVPAGQVPVDTDRWSALRDAAAPSRETGRTPAAARAQRNDGDPLERRLQRARDLAGRSRRAWLASRKALDAARDAIPDDWAERAKERIPGLGRADPYVRETARKLAVVVGSLEDIGEKSDRLREQASAIRDLKAADEANDDARRDRALERLQARRAEDSADNSDRRAREDDPPLSSDRLRARREAADA